MARGFFSVNKAEMEDNEVPDYKKESRYEISQMKKTIDRQMLIIEAMWILMKKKGYTDEELQCTISELDVPQSMKTGKPDPTEMKRCPKCNVPLQKTDSLITRCIYCGHEMVGDPFDTLD